MNGGYRYIALLLCLVVWSACPASADEPEAAFTPSTNDFGATGLLQMLNARFHDDGELVSGVSFVDLAC